MIPRLRTVAILMLLAGLSLGVFAARALRALGPGDLPPPAVGGPQRIEMDVRMIQRDYQLDDRQADKVRQELLRFDRLVRDKLLELRQRYADDFRAIYQESETRINAVLEEGRSPR